MEGKRTQEMIKLLQNNGYTNAEILKMAITLSNNEDYQDVVVKECIEKLFHSWNLTIYLRGYKYVKEVVFMCYKNPDSMRGIGKKVYPQVAQHFQTTDSAVKQNIDWFIHQNWDDANPKFKADFGGLRPSIKKFISVAIYKIRTM